MVNKYEEMDQGRLSKGMAVLGRDGIFMFLVKVGHYFKRCFCRFLTPFVILMPKSYFKFRGKKLAYFRHKRNLTWTNERAIEIPIAAGYLRNTSKERILEVGAVLPHYRKINHDVLDKFEKAPGIINADAVTYKPKTKYDAIVSISTLEHVGFDDDVKDPYGTLKALKNLRSNCLKKDGEMLVTLPLGYNKAMDKLLFSGKLGFSKEYYFRRGLLRNKWKEISKDTAYGSTYRMYSANAIVVGVNAYKVSSSQR